jgi:eukaryotic-like serine/threonine-protein kinase
MAELMYKIANEEAPDIRVVRKDLSPQIAQAVALALSKRPETRFQDGDQFASDLRLAIAELSVSKGPEAYTAPSSTAAAGADQTATEPVASGFAITQKFEVTTPDFDKTVVSSPPKSGAGS